MKKNWIIRCGVPIHVLKKSFFGYEIDFFINDHASG